LTTTIALHPHVERLITTITTLTGHEVALESPASVRRDDAHRWDVIGNAGERWAVLSVRAVQLSDPHRALYANLSRVIAHEAELRREKSALEDRFRRLDQHNAELTRQQHALSSAAYRDSLTGLYRPWYLDEQVRLEVARSTRYKRSMSLLILDVEELDDVNDRFGKHGGDDLVRAFAARLTTTCRSSDVVARVGGEEFCALLPDTVAEGAEQLIERLRTSFARSPVTIGGGTIDVVFTAGRVTFTGGADHPTTPESLLEEAKRKLHRAKHARA
jgi:diguanylate cyclase (GGDEF)-like protein